MTSAEASYWRLPLWTAVAALAAGRRSRRNPEAYRERRCVWVCGWGGLRERLTDRGVDVDLRYKGQAAANVSGGTSRDFTEAGEHEAIEINAHTDTQLSRGILELFRDLMIDGTGVTKDDPRINFACLPLANKSAGQYRPSGPSAGRECHAGDRYRFTHCVPTDCSRRAGRAGRACEHGVG